MKIAIYANKGSINQHRWIRLTGIVNADGAYECEEVGPTSRAHAIVLDHPKGAISPVVHGYAESFGAIVTADAGDALVADAELRSNADGTVTMAKKGQSVVGVSIGAAAKGAKARIMMRWGRR